MGNNPFGGDEGFTGAEQAALTVAEAVSGWALPQDVERAMLALGNDPRAMQRVLEEAQRAAINSDPNRLEQVDGFQPIAETAWWRRATLDQRITLTIALVGLLTVLIPACTEKDRLGPTYNIQNTYNYYPTTPSPTPPAVCPADEPDELTDELPDDPAAWITLRSPNGVQTKTIRSGAAGPWMDLGWTLDKRRRTGRL